MPRAWLCDGILTCLALRPSKLVAPNWESTFQAANMSGLRRYSPTSYFPFLRPSPHRSVRISIQESVFTRSLLLSMALGWKHWGLAPDSSTFFIGTSPQRRFAKGSWSSTAFHRSICDFNSPICEHRSKEIVAATGLLFLTQRIRRLEAMENVLVEGG